MATFTSRLNQALTLVEIYGLPRNASKIKSASKQNKSNLPTYGGEFTTAQVEQVLIRHNRKNKLNILTLT